MPCPKLLFLLKITQLYLILYFRIFRMFTKIISFILILIFIYNYINYLLFLIPYNNYNFIYIFYKSKLLKIMLENSLVCNLQKRLWLSCCQRICSFLFFFCLDVFFRFFLLTF